jgi:hypothetical protein
MVEDANKSSLIIYLGRTIGIFSRLAHGDSIVLGHGLRECLHIGGMADHGYTPWGLCNKVRSPGHCAEFESELTIDTTYTRSFEPTIRICSIELAHHLAVMTLTMCKGN